MNCVGDLVKKLFVSSDFYSASRGELVTRSYFRQRHDLWVTVGYMKLSIERNMYCGGMFVKFISVYTPI